MLEKEKRGLNNMAWKGVSEDEMNKKEFKNDGEFWNPEADETLQGTVKAVSKGKYGKLFMVIEDEENSDWITTQCASLDKQIKRLNIEKDDQVHITYKGRAEDEYQSHQYKLLKWEEDE